MYTLFAEPRRCGVVLCCCWVVQRGVHASGVQVLVAAWRWRVALPPVCAATLTAAAKCSYCRLVVDVSCQAGNGCCSARCLATLACLSMVRRRVKLNCSVLCGRVDVSMHVRRFVGFVCVRVSVRVSE